MGSKRKIAKDILPIILKNRKPDQYFVDICTGGGNIIDKVEGKRIGNDVNKYIIALLKAVQNGWIPPTSVPEAEYQQVKNNKDSYPDCLVGFIGFGCSFKAKFFAGYARSATQQNFALQSSNSLMKSLPALKGIEFTCGSYEQVAIPANSIIYCDIPYTNTVKYNTDFDHNKFWNWANQKVAEGHTVFVSEYVAPDGWMSVWERQVTTTNLGVPKTSLEKLFVKYDLTF